MASGEKLQWTSLARSVTYNFLEFSDMDIVAIYVECSVCDDCLWRAYPDLGYIKSGRKSICGPLPQKLFTLALLKGYPCQD